MIEFLQSAGPIIYPLAICSLLAGTITIERALALRRSRVLPREIIEVVEAIRPGRDLAVAIDVCRRNPGVFADIMRVGLEQSAQPWEVMRDAVLDVEVDLPAPREGEPPRRRRYTEDRIRERSELVQLAIDARRVHRPDEDSFRYAPLADEPSRVRTPEARANTLSRYAEGYIFI